MRARAGTPSDALRPVWEDPVSTRRAVAGMALWHAVKAAKALFEEATTTLSEGHAALKFTAHCSATQSEHSTPMMTPGQVRVGSRLCASNSFEENVDAVILFGPSSKERVIACNTPGRADKSLPATSPPNCEGLTGLAMSSETPSNSSNAEKEPSAVVARCKTAPQWSPVPLTTEIDVALAEDVPCFQVTPDAADVKSGPFRRVGHEAPPDSNNHGASRGSLVRRRRAPPTRRRHPKSAVRVLSTRTTAVRRSPS